MTCRGFRNLSCKKFHFKTDPDTNRTVSAEPDRRWKKKRPDSPVPAIVWPESEDEVIKKKGTNDDRRESESCQPCEQGLQFGNQVAKQCPYRCEEQGTEFEHEGCEGVCQGALGHVFPDFHACKRCNPWWGLAEAPAVARTEGDSDADEYEFVNFEEGEEEQNFEENEEYDYEDDYDDEDDGRETA